MEQNRQELEKFICRYCGEKIFSVWSIVKAPEDTDNAVVFNSMNITMTLSQMDDIQGIRRLVEAKCRCYTRKKDHQPNICQWNPDRDPQLPGYAVKRRSHRILFMVFESIA